MVTAVYLVMHVPTCQTELSCTTCSKCQCVIDGNSSPSDKALDLSLVPPGVVTGKVLIRPVYEFTYLFIVLNCFQYSEFRYCIDYVLAV